MQMPVPALKAQIASVTGVVSDQQRLICRGKVLKDDQLLSAYHVEDGHTLHLVVRQPIPPSAEGAPSHTASDPSSGANRISSTHISPSVVIETFNVEHGDGVPPEIGQIVSAVLGSFGLTNLGSSTEGRSERSSAGGSVVNLTQQQSEPSALRGLSSAFGLPQSLSVGQPPVIPDSLMTMSQYVSHMRGEFSNFGRGSGSTASPSAEGGDSNFLQSSGAVREGLPTPASLSELMLSTRRLLTEQVGECLELFAGQLENQANFTDSSMRSNTQSNAMRIGMLFHYLGAYILELGRTAMTLRLGRSPAESAVNAGPAVYISPLGPNPLMVQPFPFQMGSSIGNIPVGTVQPSSNLGGGIGTGFLPRRIDIQIRRGSPTAVPNANREEHSDQQQPVSASRNAAVNSSAAENPVEQSSSRTSEGPTQPFAGESGVRVVPVRTMVAAVPATFSRMPSDSSSDSPSLRVQASISRNANSNSPSAGDLQNHQESGRQVPGSIYQFLRNLFPGGEIHGEEESSIGVGTVPGLRNEEISNPSRDSREPERGATGDGIFFSNLLHQIMPIISEQVAGADSSSARDRDSSFQAASSAGGGTSHRPSDTDLDPPNSKRQKK
ncbi:hypothetical protein CRG98_012938 [Punica granatum]|uniref:Ubiquitin-like domain-containing protein n=1 Tax=Punica granatum TaxID=22663 RepID=A0A2I0KEZ7_PUNGR|nr:hypothetical protein CRG98_012938 [Punica granatum]